MIEPTRSVTTHITSAPETAAAPDADAPPLLPPPGVPSIGDMDVGGEMELLALKSARDDAHLARELRQRNEDAAEAAESAQLHAMQERSDDAYGAGLVSGFSTAAAGLTMGAGAWADKMRPVWEGASKLVEGGGHVGSAVFQHESDEANIEATHQEQLAGRFRKAADDQRDAVKEARTLGDQAIAFYKEYTAAKAEAQKAVLFRA